MALADLTFKLYTDSGLTTLFSGLHQLIHETDLSDGDQDFQLWYGSTVAGRTLQATSNPSVDNITITPVEILPEFALNTVYTAGQLIEPTVQNGNKYIVTIGGTSDASVEPTWPTSGIGSAVTSGTATFELYQATHEPTEAKLALTAGGLAGATAGAALSLGATLTSEVANAVEINVRYTNTVTTVGNNTGQPELGFDYNERIET